MNLVKWFRKNNTKIMAVVVIVLMIGFIGGSSLSYILRGSGGMHDTVAWYGGKRHKITPYDRALARQELEILQALRLDRWTRAQDLTGLLLSEVLFTQTQAGATPIVEAIKQTVQQNRYRVSDKQLSEMYNRTVPADVYWLLLRDEAESAGFHIRSEDIGEGLGQLIPRLFEQRPYATVMRDQVDHFGVPEDNILATFGKLVAVLKYAETICSMESVTTSQIRYMAAAEGEPMDVEFVRIEAASFADKETTPPQADLVAQFDRYKDVFAGAVSEADPYGFGYKLPARLQLEYIALKLKDVSSITKPPTAQEAEEYYRQNRDQLFTEQVPSDPNDPNSPRVSRVRNYAEVVDTIHTRLLGERIAAKAKQILIEARSLADADLETDRSREQKPALEQLKKEAGDYDKIAQDLGQKFNLALYSGRTGLLTATDIQQDKHLSNLFLTDYGYNPIRLSQMLFTVEELGDDAVTLMTAPTVEMYRSIGPAQDPAAATTSNLSGQIMAIVRIVDVKQAGPPESLDVTFSTKTLGIADDPEDKANTVYSVKEEVVDDVRKLAAWDTTKSKADELAALAAKDGWEQAVTEFNKLYGEQAKAEPNDPNAFRLDQLVAVQPISNQQLAAIKAQTANNPSAAMFVERLVNEQQFIDELYSLVPPDANSLPQTPLVMEYKPNQSFYCLKSISIERLTQERFRQMKGFLLRREEYTEAQNLAIAHLTPKNILQRMQFEFIKEGVEPVRDETAPPLPEDAF